MGKKALIHRKLTYSEEARGHARARHSSPTLPAGPSIDAYLKSRFGNNVAEGSKMSAFLSDDDQDRAVAYAFTQVDKHQSDGVRTTMRVRVDGTLRDITVRVVEKVGGSLEGYAAKLREVLVVVDHLGKSAECIITAYPSDTYRT